MKTKQLQNVIICEVMITPFDNDWEFIHDQDIVSKPSSWYGGNDTQLQYPHNFQPN